MKNKDEILIGACDVYMYEFTGTEIPEHATIETEEHDVGHCSSGFTVNYKPTKYDVKNQYGQIVKSAIRGDLGKDGSFIVESCECVSLIHWSLQGK